MANVDDFSPLLLLAHFGTLLATYLKGTPGFCTNSRYSSMHIIDEYMRGVHAYILVYYITIACNYLFHF